MSAMSNMWISIQQMLIDGYSFNTISNILDIPVEWVVEVASTMEQNEHA